MLWVIDAFKLVHSVNAEKKLIFLCLFLTLLSALCLQAIHLGHIYSVYCDLQRPPLAKINFNFYVNEKRMKKKNEFNGDVAWFLKRMESAWCKRTIMEELFFFLMRNWEDHACPMTSGFPGCNFCLKSFVLICLINYSWLMCHNENEIWSCFISSLYLTLHTALKHAINV